MRLKLNSYLCSLLVMIMLFASGTNVFASGIPIHGSDQYTPKVTLEEDTIEPLPNAIPITLTPSHERLVVHVGNIGVDPLDSVTVTGSATDYGTLAPQTAKVPPVIGTSFVWNVPMTKAVMNYYVTITVVDGSQTRVLYGSAKLEFSESHLAALGWNAGTFSSRGASLNYHFSKHRAEVNAANMHDYIFAAGTCRQDVINNPSNYRKTANSGSIPAHKYKNNNDGRFIILTDSNNEILSFGR
ncbi:hypothetical protein [Paenibacillus sp. 481]|uniref:hypothetical protein n=1 Tax=Paenibacillus sp. 481 TaxID=2835869 RepID=UPI001E2EA966|nr:hypothetical protein [Paenibacillus sp. 481]UHA71771.1 hypothetical protein KIK04_13415 [Paenibacillus sp. 481]